MRERYFQRLQRSSLLWATGLVLACGASMAQAQPQAQNQAQNQPQELHLFESVTGQTTTTPSPAAPSPAGNGQPAYTLVGTSRFGDNYRVHLKSQSGDTVTVRGRPGETVAVPGNSAYRIADFGAREVSILHPANVPCVADEAKGVYCEGGNTARLTVATAAPIEPPAPPQERRRGRNGGNGGNGGNGAANGNGAEEPSNPFAAALRAARERSPEDEAVMRAQAERFERRRIDPADLPEGARVVRTPFGDRIIRNQD